ncbi:MAG: Pr6Pr family membrane protein [Clostridia bacterium]
MIKDRLFALIYRLFATVVTIMGILVTVGVFGGITAGAKAFLYYTLQSNMLALALFIYLAARSGYDLIKNGRFGSAGYVPRFEAMVMIAITLTMFVFWGMLAPMAGEMWGYLSSFGNLAVHTFVPVLVIVDYVLFPESGHLTKRDPWLCLIIPLTYFLVSTILGFSGAVTFTGFGGEATRFPYFFIDFDQQGWFVALWVILLASIFVGLMYLVLYLDKKFKKKQILPRKSK